METRSIRQLGAVRFSPGDRAGNLTVLRAVRSKHFKRGVAVVFLCRCDCGVEVERDRQTLIKAKRSSCGCTRAGLGTSAPGLWKHPLRKTWGHMLDRCLNPQNKSYADYGGREIGVCPEWVRGDGALSGLECFIRDMGEKPDPKLTIERVNGDLGYEPSNCIWADRFVQARNRRCARLVTFAGRTATVAEWAAERGIGYFTLLARLNSGWDDARALTQAVRSH